LEDSKLEFRLLLYLKYKGGTMPFIRQRNTDWGSFRTKCLGIYLHLK